MQDRFPVSSPPEQNRATENFKENLAQDKKLSSTLM